MYDAIDTTEKHTTGVYDDKANSLIEFLDFTMDKSRRFEILGMYPRTLWLSPDGHFFMTFNESPGKSPRLLLTEGSLKKFIRLRGT